MMISFVIPIYNEADSISETLKMIEVACEFAGLNHIEVLVIDDGSTDTTVEVVLNYLSSYIQIKIVRQANLGRFAARYTGALNASNSDLIFIDSRVWIHQASLENLIRHKKLSPDSEVIIGMVDLPLDVNLVGRFWRSLEKIFWHRFYRNVLNVSLTLENFHRYPKGTTLVYFDRKNFLEICEDINTKMLADKNSNDDTLLFYRFLENGGRVEIIRQFTATYFPRRKLKSFLQHARHRGSVAGDGFLQLRTFQGVLFRFSYIAIFLFGYLLFSYPVLWIPFVILGLAASVLLMLLPLSLKDFFSLSLLAFPFYIQYSIGFFSNFVRKVRRRVSGC